MFNKKRLLLLLLSTITLVSWAQEGSDWQFTIQGGGTRGQQMTTGTLGGQVTYQVNPKLEVGFNTYVQSRIGQELTDAEGKSYHLTTAVGTLVIKPKFPLGRQWEIAFPLETGNGFLQYRYTREYQRDLTWTEEVLDQLNFGIYSAGLELKRQLGSMGALSGSLGYTGTSPLLTRLSEPDALQGAWIRLGYTFSL